MSQQANVTQIDAIKHFRAVLVQYQAALRDACELLMHEGTRGIDWVETDRSSFWPSEVRRTDEALLAAKNALEQCVIRAVGDDRPSCIDEKKAVDRLKNRLEKSRGKVKETQSWKGKIHREGDDFHTRMVQVNDHADSELPKAIAALDRMIEALEQYATRTDGPPKAAGATGAAPIKQNTSSADGSA